MSVGPDHVQGKTMGTRFHVEERSNRNELIQILVKTLVLFWVKISAIWSASFQSTVKDV